MKIISSILLTLGVGGALMSASVCPATLIPEKVEVDQTAQILKTRFGKELNGSIKVITPQKDLASAISESEHDDVLLQGPDGWYRIEGKSIKQGTKMYVLNGQDGMVNPMPKTEVKSSKKTTAHRSHASKSSKKSEILNSAIKVIAPQKDLKTAILHSEKGDILLMGPEGWYRIEGKSLQQGTKMYVLGGQESMISAFPKEAVDSAAR